MTRGPGDTPWRTEPGTGPVIPVAGALPILYSFRRCPYAMRARLALCQAGVVTELREVDLRDKPQALRTASAAATVPVLDLGAGAVLAQSLDIMRWALAQNDPAAWATRGDAVRAGRLVDTNDGDFKQALDRYKYAERHPQRSRTDYRDDAVSCLIEPLEAALAPSGFVGGASPCWADAAMFPFVRQFAAVDAAWWEASPWSATRRWLQGWQSGALFAACMRKYAVWQPGHAPLRFPW